MNLFAKPKPSPASLTDRLVQHGVPWTTVQRREFDWHQAELAEDQARTAHMRVVERIRVLETRAQMLVQRASRVASEAEYEDVRERQRLVDRDLVLGRNELAKAVEAIDAAHKVTEAAYAAVQHARAHPRWGLEDRERHRREAKDAKVVQTKQARVDEAHKLRREALQKDLARRAREERGAFTDPPPVVEQPTDLKAWGTGETFLIGQDGQVRRRPTHPA